MKTGRELHEYIRDRIELALGPRSWNWLARQTGVARSTLEYERKKPHFSLDILLLIAGALKRDLGFFLPVDAPIGSGSD